MGSSCSSGQGHKDKDSISTKSEESPAYQLIVKKASTGGEADVRTQGNHSGVVLEPCSLAPQQSTSGVTNVPAPAGPRGLRNVTTSSVSDTISIPSPQTMSPRDTAESTLPQPLTSLMETFQNMITGRITSEDSLSSKTRKICIYVCAADSQDCCVEKGVLHQVVAPELAAYCREKKYELHITDLHWKTGLEKQQDHEFPELCLGELNRQSEVGYIIPVLFLSNSLGTPLLPKTIETQDFEMALSQAEDKDSLNKWYRLDKDAQPPCYRLLPIACHIPGFKEDSWSERERALEEWRSEIERTLTAMISSFSEELRNTYLTTVVEQEVHNTILMSQELARRCLWLYRVYSHRPEATQTETMLEQEQKRRLDMLYKELRSQLTEKHVVRLSVPWNEGGLDQSIPAHAQYISDVTSHLLKYLKATIFTIIEEDQSKAVLRSQYGVEASFLNELKWQTMFCEKAVQSSVTRDQILSKLQSYVTSCAVCPLLVQAAWGNGKTTILARAIHCIRSWLPDSYTVFRFAKISTLSFSMVNILSTVVDHLSLLAYGHRAHCAHNIAAYSLALEELISAIAIQRPLVIILDGLDHLNTQDFSWLPWKLPNNAKLILSAESDGSLAKLFAEKKLGENSLVEIPELEEKDAGKLLLSSVIQYSHSASRKAAESISSALQNCTLPLYVKVLAWRKSWFSELQQDFQPKANLKDEMNLMLDGLDAMLDKERVTMALSIISVSKYGLRESELLDILAHESAFHSQQTYLKWAPACIFLSRLSKLLNPFLHWVSDGEHAMLSVSDHTLCSIIQERYVQNSNIYNQLIHDYFQGKWHGENLPGLQGKYLSQPCRTEKWLNKRKLLELSYQSIVLKQDVLSRFLLNESWIFDKICGVNANEVLDDLNLVNDQSNKDLLLLRKLLEDRHEALNYDGRQFYSQLHEVVSEYKEGGLSLWSQVAAKTPPIASLVMTTGAPLLDGVVPATTDINFIVRLSQNPNFVVSVSTEKEEISVWDVNTNERVRHLTGVTQPVQLQLIDDTRAVVLCRRELRIYNLEEGVLLTKLKGVMNQKMPYFGLADTDHLVALSRNRMYVNVMHLGSGDCVATFKAGEDRFLNSLLVSGDGRILVCGDETQKPFPLLVWDLSSRKLLYDLRIPHHDFLTSYSAITHEGHYVCCVAKEVDEPGPNFIVVYDLQSGTLFKKWKPGVDTTSLDISSKDSCVISGLADARILVWDLVTGNCRWSLRGHSAPVTLVRRDPLGGSFMSADSENRDRSLRLWDLNNGDLLAVYTPTKEFTACEYGIGGKSITMALKGNGFITTLHLKGATEAAQDADPGSSALQKTYGDPKNHGRSFDLSDKPEER